MSDPFTNLVEKTGRAMPAWIDVVAASGLTKHSQIVDVVAGGPADAEGIVEFRASFRGPEGAGLVHERSRFARDGERWRYLEAAEGGR